MRILIFVTVMLLGACAIEPATSTAIGETRCQLGQCNPGDSGDEWTEATCAQYTADWATSHGATRELSGGCSVTTSSTGVKTRTCHVTAEFGGSWLTVYCDWILNSDGTSTLDHCAAF